ncbi:MAG: hypothetical protein DDT25_01153 [Chloroflexi bacterium]|nr:hypothetical protein [Chloroflexota bacterium]
MKLEEYLKMLRARYEAYFDTSPDYSILGRTVDLYARCHVRNEKFFLSRKATLGAWETSEYCLVEGHPVGLGAAKVRDFAAFLVRAADELVKPHEEHMSSIVSGILVSERGFEPEAIRIGTGFKHERSFWFGLRGWCSVCLLLVDLSTGQVYASPKGKEVMRIYLPKAGDAQLECLVAQIFKKEIKGYECYMDVGYRLDRLHRRLSNLWLVYRQKAGG